MEVVRLLYLRLLSVQKHPGGKCETDNSLATVSLNPKLVAAASHDVLSKMDFLLITLLHVPLSGLGYPNAPTSFFRHDPPPTSE